MDTQVRFACKKSGELKQEDFWIAFLRRELSKDSVLSRFAFTKDDEVNINESNDKIKQHN